MRTKRSEAGKFFKSLPKKEKRLLHKFEIIMSEMLKLEVEKSRILYWGGDTSLRVPSGMLKDSQERLKIRIMNHLDKCYA